MVYCAHNTVVYSDTYAYLSKKILKSLDGIYIQIGIFRYFASLKTFLIFKFSFIFQIGLTTLLSMQKVSNTYFRPLIYLSI